MRIQVDLAVCTGHAQCCVNGPDVYDVDDEGYCDVGADGALEVPAGLEDQARTGALACPEQAITVSP